MFGPCFLRGLQVLKCPKSDVEVVRGLKSRDKTIAVSVDAKGDEQQAVSDVREKIEDAVE